MQKQAWVSLRLSNLLVEGMCQWVRFVENHARYTLIALIILSMLAGFISVRYSKINSDLSTLVKPSDKLTWYRDNEIYKDLFPELQQMAVVVVSGTDHGKVERSARRLLTGFRQNRKFDSVFAPSLDEFLNTRKLYFLDEANFDLWIQAGQYNYGSLLRLADSTGMTNAVFTFADQVSSVRGLPAPEPLASFAESFNGSDPEIEFRAYPRLVDEAKEKYYELISIKGQQQHEKSLPNREIVRNIHSVVDQTPIEPGVEVRLTGEVALSDEELSAGLSGIGLAGTLSLLLLLVILGVGIRSWRVIAVIFSLLLMGVILTTGFATIAVGSYNVLSLIFVVMFFGLGVDFAVHFTLRVREATAEIDINEACLVAVKDIGPALVLCMLTSMIAFLSFSPTAYRGLAELGFISAGGMFIACSLTLTLLPALFSEFGAPEQETAQLRAIEFNLNPSYVLVVATGLALIAFSFAREVRFDYSVLAMRDASTEAMATLLDLQDDKITTDYSISVLADDAEQAHDLKRRLQKLDVVGDVTLPDDFIPSDQAAKQEKLQALYELYETIEEILPSESTEGLLDAFEYLDESVTYIREEDKPLLGYLNNGLKRYVDDEEMLGRLDQQLFNGVNSELVSLRTLLKAQPFALDDVPDDLKRRMITSQGKHLMTVQPVNPLITRQATEEFINEVSRIAPNISGRSVVEWGVGNVVVGAFRFAGTVSLLCILALLILYFRNLILPIFVLVPIFLSILFTFAICQITGITLNMANILVVPLIIGLGVGTGIHVVHRYTQTGGVESVYTSSTARAVLISALTTVGAFFSLSFSPHKGAASVGLLLTIAISLLIVFTFLVLPALLRISKR